MPNIHDTLSRMMQAGKFEPFLRHIRFPHFRNMREGTCIEFSHPVTALVGPNGTNKTAILRALQGCPDYYNLGNFWFSTSLDPISESERHRFIHGYYSKSAERVVEVIKTRITRPENPDYFEPSRPLIQDGMDRMPPIAEDEILPPDRVKTRWKAIQKPVVYLDFRSELSAYDKYFFHFPYKPRTGFNVETEKKAKIRRRSPYLVDALKTGRTKHYWYNLERIVVPAHMATAEQVRIVSDILGRAYDSIQIMAHRYFNVEGLTVVLKASGLQYSEAFAGSGEFAVAVLVTTVMKAKRGSLILLDEPEVSLHPGAQRKLMQFLCDQAKLGNHQIVVCTHSPETVSELPSKAIKVLHASEIDGKVELVSQESHPAEAFFRLGVRISRSKTVYVEDGLAAAIVRRAVQPLGEALNAQLEISVIPGGANGIRTKFVPSFALTGNVKSLVILDGDQRPENPVSKSSATLDEDLPSIVKDLAGGVVQISPDGSGGTSNTVQKNSQLRLVLEWFESNVDYLPGGDAPENLLCAMAEIEYRELDAKLYWDKRTRNSLGRADWQPKVTSAEILFEQEMVLAKVSLDHPSLVAIRRRVEEFLNKGGLKS